MIHQLCIIHRSEVLICNITTFAGTNNPLTIKLIDVTIVLIDKNYQYCVDVDINVLSYWLTSVMMTVKCEHMWTNVNSIFLVQVRIRTEVLPTKSLTRSGFELMTSRSWQYTPCHWDACSNHSVINDFYAPQVGPDWGSNPWPRCEHLCHIVALRCTALHDYSFLLQIRDFPIRTNWQLIGAKKVINTAEKCERETH